MVTLILAIVLLLARVPAGESVPYDAREALYAPGQSVTGTLRMDGTAPGTMYLLAEPVFRGANPAFQLVANVNGNRVAYACQWQRARSDLALPLPGSSPTGNVPVTVTLEGTPTREADYLLVYSASERGGLLVGLRPVTDTVTPCVAQAE